MCPAIQSSRTSPAQPGSLYISHIYSLKVVKTFLLRIETPDMAIAMITTMSMFSFKLIKALSIILSVEPRVRKRVAPKLVPVGKLEIGHNRSLEKSF